MDERVLKPGGGALIKVCRVPGLQERPPRKFAELRLSKPQPSLSRTRERYLLAKDFLMV